MKKKGQEAFQDSETVFVICCLFVSVPSVNSLLSLGGWFDVSDSVFWLVSPAKVENLRVDGGCESARSGLSFFCYL